MINSNQSGGQKDRLLLKIRNGEEMTIGEQARLALLLSIPAILAQLSSVMMSYIDSAMVGKLGAAQSASIGLVSTSTWIIGGFCMASINGFTVQVAHLIGSNDLRKARGLLRQALAVILVIAAVIASIAMAISGGLPHWLGGGEDICADASAYVRIYSLFVPAFTLSYFGSSMLHSSGNMKVPSILNVMMCVMDVCFNYLFIYVCGMGVRGAALGTGTAEAVTAVLMLYFLLVRSPELSLRREGGSFMPQWNSLRRAFGISGPLYIQNIVTHGAHIVATLIIAPLGTISIAANSFAITAESICYMPGYGISDAARTLIGQSLGAKRKSLAKQFARINILMGAGIMTLLAVLMFILAPQIMAMLSIDSDVVALGAKMLRIEAFAETLYACSIVAYGCCVGAGDTLVPSAMNLVSMWVVRIGLALFLTPRLGLTGYWVAMCIELNVRGLIFLWRVRGERWMKNVLT